MHSATILLLSSLAIHCILHKIYHVESFLNHVSRKRIVRKNDICSITKIRSNEKDKAQPTDGDEYHENYVQEGTLPTICFTDWSAITSNVSTSASSDELTTKLMNVLSDDEDVDTFDLITEQAVDQSLEKAVKQMVGSVSSSTIDPVDKFNTMYKSLKANGKNKTKRFNASEMLLELFPAEEAKDPFDEKKVIIKLRQMLDAEDFKGLFLDANIGDLY